jgi:hypothetical protein
MIGLGDQIVDPFFIVYGKRSLKEAQDLFGAGPGGRCEC